MSAELEPSPLAELSRERIAACLLESMPSDGEIARARRRVLMARAVPRRQTKALVVALAYGAVLGLASAAAASFVADRVLPATTPAPVSATPKQLQTVGPARAGWARTARISPAEAPTAPAPPPTAAFAPLPSEAVGVPAALAPAEISRRTVAEAPGRPNPNQQQPLQPIPIPPSATAPKAPPAGTSVATLPPVASAGAPSGPWERVAKALAAEDWSSADKALNEIDHSGDAHARDAAALARAQLWITQGRGAEVRPILERLATRGMTPLIRRRAAALLRGL